LFINTTLHGLMTLFEISAFLSVIEEGLVLCERYGRFIVFTSAAVLFSDPSRTTGTIQLRPDLGMTIDDLEVLEKSRQFDFQSRYAFSWWIRS